jgi:hypothetical protein
MPLGHGESDGELHLQAVLVAPRAEVAEELFGAAGAVGAD